MEAPQAKASAGYLFCPEVVREIALWWQRELDRARAYRRHPRPPLVRRRYAAFPGVHEEEALRGSGLGEQRHFFLGSNNSLSASNKTLFFYNPPEQPGHPST